MPSVRSVAAALACVGSVSAKQWYLADTYDATNFFDKFTFFSDADPNSGHVVYKSQSEAESLGLAKYEDSEVYLGPDNTNVLDSDTGRPSVRLQSASAYNHGLFIARFSHLPEASCGSWPAFWTVGNTWPDDGEIDIIEGWNLQTTNAPAFHTGDSDEFGTCKLDGSDQTATVDTPNCDNTYSDDDQSLNQGCTGDDTAAPYGLSEGGVYALEWTDSYIKLFAWTWANVPSNLDSSSPDTDSWGTPNMYLKNANCDIDNHFIDQTLIINIAFCGNPVGNTDVWAAACKAKTGYDTCNAYVSAEPTAFADTYFKIQDIRYFKTTKSASASSSAAVAETTPAATTTPVAAVTNTLYNNASAIVSTTAAADEMTTSTVYATSVHTVTSCAATVTNCPVGSVVTETVALYTTVCPVTAAEASASAAITASVTATAGSGSDDAETITTTITNVHTITSCAATVTNCPATTSTELITVTYCPGNTGSGSGSGSSAAATAVATATPVTGSDSSAETGSDSSSGESASSSGFFPAPAPSASTPGSDSYATAPAPAGTAAGTPAAGTPPAGTPPAGTPAAGTPSGSPPASGFQTAPAAGSTPVASIPAAGAGEAYSSSLTPVATPAATTTPAAGSSSSEVPVTGAAGKMSVSLALVFGAVVALMM